MKNKKHRLILILLFLLVITSSCAKRRYDYLSEKREGILQERKEKAKAKESFDPDKLRSLSFSEYKKWYKSLKTAPKLSLKKATSPKALTNEQMIEDFNYYFEQIKDNYPFFAVLKREEGIDFLANYNSYLEEIKACKTDQEFIEKMKEISKDLKNQHAVIADKSYVESTLDYYSNYWDNASMYYDFLLLNSQKVRNRYNINNLVSNENESSWEKRLSSATGKEDKQTQNLTVSEIKPDILMIKVNQMLADNLIEDDLKTLEKAMDNKNAYSKIILDIRDNSGGNMSYWIDFLLPYFITKEERVENHMFFKDGQRSKQILDLENYDYEKIEDVNLDSLNLEHKEDLKDFSYYRKDIISIKPNATGGFSGKMYLLTNENVFSAAEGLASFVKNTSLMTIIGQKTGGDGITTGIINDYMPSSGLVFTYTNTLGYAADGSINEEEKTSPDYKSQSFRQTLDIIKNDK